jgi:rhodanese-related sulfurtransferase
MSSVRVVSPEDAKNLVENGYKYLDVRSESEFEAGHPPGAVNVPLQHLGPTGLESNPEFLRVVAGNFPKDARLVVGCKAGGRSRRAVEILLAEGYTELVDFAAGWDGKRDAFGRLQPGWSRLGFPIETGLPAGRRYKDLSSLPE